MKIQTNSKYQKEDRTYYFTTVDRAIEIPDLRYVDRWHVIQMYDRHTFNSRRQLIHLNGQSMLAR